jgi:hypothetical protein
MVAIGHARQCAAAAIFCRRHLLLPPPPKTQTACIHYLNSLARLLLHMEIKDPDGGLVKQLRFAFLGFTVSYYSVSRVQSAAAAARRPLNA